MLLRLNARRAGRRAAVGAANGPVLQASGLVSALLASTHAMLQLYSTDSCHHISTCRRATVDSWLM
jgi:hypothetical protein